MNLKFNELLKKAGIDPSLCRFTPITDGGNNRLFRVNYEGDLFIIKSYFYHPNDKRDRLKHEFLFLKYLYENDTQIVPRPIECDFKNHIGLYEYIDGSKPTSKSVNIKNIDQFIFFLKEINNHKTNANYLPNAIESCFSIQDYIKSVQWRINKLSNLRLDDDISINKSISSFITKDLTPKWNRIASLVIDKCIKFKIDINIDVELSQQCLSPSDFGFHNVIQKGEGSFIFLDFEYAGWDDSVKMVCDFCCHPGSNIPEKYWNHIINEMLSIFPEYELNIIRTRILMPLIQLKWCCIILNEFIPVSKERRAFSQNQVDVSEERKMEQLNKSKKLFETIEL